MEEFALKYVLKKNTLTRFNWVDNYCQIKENIKFVIPQILILIYFEYKVKNNEILYLKKLKL